MLPSTPTAALRVRNLRKTFKDVVAVDGLELEVRTGECFGLLGPNGAGKTTTIEICEGLTDADSGDVELLGMRWDSHGAELRQRLGIQLQETQLADKVTVLETIRLFRSFFRHGPPPSEVIALVQLEEKMNSRVGGLSGGQKQRLALACALVGDPDFLFLDEPTTGLDPQARRQLWELIERFKLQGRTILLTTHYIEEAERLCDRVAIIDQGRIIAMDTPRKLQQQSRAASTIVVTCDKAFPRDRPVWAEAMNSTLDETSRTMTVVSGRPATTLVDLIKWIDQSGFELLDVHLKQPTLEDVFIELTGKRLRE